LDGAGRRTGAYDQNMTTSGPRRVVQFNAMMKTERLEAALPGLREMLRACCACGHRCGVDRTGSALGFCDATAPDLHHAAYASRTLHFGEEPPLVGRGGSGAVFFSGCNLRCVFCQNHQISQGALGENIHFRELARIFLEFQDQGAENINLVTPTHYVHPIIEALLEASRQGLRLPIVYNTNGYESIELLAMLEGIVDVYLPDMKYIEAAHGFVYSRAEDYPSVAKRAIKEMYRQVGPVAMEDGVAKRGLIVRHLILPNNLSNTYDFLLWMRDEGMEQATVSLMSQYSPQFRANEYPELDGRIGTSEYRRIVEYAVYLPDFRRDVPFNTD
jgi:putative pyruvate formate lyase activating enzyme